MQTGVSIPERIGAPAGLHWRDTETMTGTGTWDSHAEYSRRLEARLKEASKWEARHRQIGNARLAVALAGIVMAWRVIGPQALSAYWLAAPLAAFIALAIWHERVIRSFRRASRAAAYYRRALDRLEGNWVGKGEPGERFRDPHHPFAEDLDLFGRGSLFDMICAARTRAGEEVLARWFLEPADPDEIRARQQAIEELRFRVDLREYMAQLGEDVRAGVHPEALSVWGAAPPLLDSRGGRVVCALAALLNIAGLLAAVEFSQPLLLVWTLMASTGCGFYFRERVKDVIREVEIPAHDLALLRDVLLCIERQTFQSPKLAKLRAALEIEGQPPSKRIARLNRLVEMLDSRDNLAVRMIGPPLLWSTQLAFAVEAWRRVHGPAVRKWLEAVGEVEAICSLAAYAFAHPHDPFPEIVESGPCFEAEAITHPMLVESKAVRNDVRLGKDLKLLVVSGSNMSGKSTLLRTVGVNAVLAMAGAPVRAKRLVISPLAIGASIRVTDSLQDGSSRFYAEITRLRQLVDMAGGSRPLLFLLDELLHGTNSHDRRIGAEAVVRELVERGAIGLITTHDLALAHIAEVLAPAAANVHFEDHLEDGRIRFDYKLRPGVSKKSNALELMRSVGLHV